MESCSWSTSFDTKQPPYRILYRRGASTICIQIAVAETEKQIEAAWAWVQGMKS